MLPVIGAIGARDIMECFFETRHVVLYESNAEGKGLVSRRGTLMSESFRHI
jgi:hypothetical protein